METKRVIAVRDKMFNAIKASDHSKKYLALIIAAGIACSTAAFIGNVCGAPPPVPHTLYGLVKSTGGNGINDATIKVTNARTGEFLFNNTYYDSLVGDGVWIVVDYTFPSGCIDGDTLTIHASKTGYVSAETWVIFNASVSVQHVEDIILTTSTNPPPFELLPSGWSLFSVPFNSSISIEDVSVVHNSVNYSFGDAVDVGLVLRWIYTVNRTTGMYEVVNTLMTDYGFWIYCYEPIELCVNGNSSDGDAVDPSIGWNLIGMPCYHNVSLINLTVMYNSSAYSWDDAVTSNLIMPYLYTIDRDTGAYLAIRAHTDHDKLWAGYGYWMYCYEDVKLFVTDA